eukprot:TRINITY_DN111598_c0_g1_i2.p2 TRINITY_DN111598_c0_g1~~TRINITY_DN111598_c0_g1_i2.p2  ORF type:complete len:183 (+),score=22.66 TRINITY_DN111598_c0_g1_i2:114-662(+)
MGRLYPFSASLLVCALGLLTEAPMATADKPDFSAILKTSSDSGSPVWSLTPRGRCAAVCAAGVLTASAACLTAWACKHGLLVISVPGLTLDDVHMSPLDKGGDVWIGRGRPPPSPSEQNSRHRSQVGLVLVLAAVAVSLGSVVIGRRRCSRGSRLPTPTQQRNMREARLRQFDLRSNSAELA